MPSTTPSDRKPRKLIPLDQAEAIFRDLDRQMAEELEKFNRERPLDRPKTL